jgi:hypothetical protein
VNARAVLVGMALLLLGVGWWSGVECFVAWYSGVEPEIPAAVWLSALARSAAAAAGAAALLWAAAW